MKSMNEMNDGRNATRQSFFGRAWSPTPKKKEYTIGSDSQKPSSCADSRGASSSREDQMTDTTLENPTRIMKESWGSLYM